ncbi:restriction endonuclease [Micromonospora sp. WMMD980]|uniref:restriction endonuclease n=1 Tax=Micromonospora sp. WMMD980 TaxID=3016088 RepID=UPI002416B86F|nr:restriction endonuclease [Micromonospora sp. WMMD980]MDG4798937.1 restriction endonuclease [Micromonospora sp. WMMD980]MDG4805121.1 restriction endonuclease [Micromonospora sp. WMMD980]
MPEFKVEVEAEDATLADLCSMYWATEDDGSFSWTVKELSERFEQPAHKISKTVSESCYARSSSKSCVECGKGFIYRTRSEWTSGHRFAPTRCRTCVESEKQRLEADRRRAAAAMQAAISEHFEVAESGSPIRAEDLDLPSALAVAALFEDGEEVSEGVTVPVVERGTPLTPTSDLDLKLLKALIDRGILQIHPSSSSDAFVWKDDGTLDNQHYPMLASYYLTGTGDVESRLREYLKGLSQIISRDNWPDRWTDQFSDFWFDLAVSECKAYLVHMLKRHGLDFTPGQRTEEVFRHALRWYSIGQMYYFIWRAARDSAAYMARERVPAKQAANSAITRISGDVDRAYAQGWDVSVYRRDSRLPQSTISHILFSRALQLEDAMAYSPVDLPVRRAGLELAWEKIDFTAFERLIFQLVVETEGYENVDWLMHTNAADHGRDVSAMRLRKDPLSGHSSQRVAIQCKHWLSRAIRDTDASQAVVSISHWDNPPFDVLVLATSGRFTSDAIAWIERHNSRGQRPIIEVWNDARLEFLLNERPHLIRSFGLR